MGTIELVDYETYRDRYEYGETTHGRFKFDKQFIDLMNNMSGDDPYVKTKLLNNIVYKIAMCVKNDIKANKTLFLIKVGGDFVQLYANVTRTDGKVRVVFTDAGDDIATYVIDL